MKLVKLSERVWYYPYEPERDRPNLGYIKGDNWSLAVDAGHSATHGIYTRIKKDKTMSKVYLLASFVFVSVGTLYHNVFAIAAYIYNRLVNGGIGNAESLTLEVFNTFIWVGSLAALGYAAMVVVMFFEAIRGNVYPHKWMCIINPAFFMIICILLSKILPQTAFVNGVFDLVQQSVGLFIVFLTLYFTCENQLQEKQSQNI